MRNILIAVVLQITLLLILSTVGFATDASKTLTDAEVYESAGLLAIDGNLLYSVMEDKLDNSHIVVWDINSGNVLKDLKINANGLSERLRFAIDDKFIYVNTYSSSEFGTLRLLNKNSLETFKEFELNLDITSMEVNGNFIYAGLWSDNNLHILDKATMEKVKTLEGHTDVIWYLKSDELYVYTSSFDGTLKIWDKSDDSIKATIEIGNSAVIETDDKNIYIRTSYHLTAYDKRTFEKVYELKSLDGLPNDVKADGNYVYANFIDKIYVLGRNFTLAKTLSANGDNIENIPKSISKILVNKDKIVAAYNNKIRIWDKSEVFSSREKYLPEFYYYTSQKRIEKVPSGISPPQIDEKVVEEKATHEIEGYIQKLSAEFEEVPASKNHNPIYIFLILVAVLIALFFILISRRLKNH